MKFVLTLALAGLSVLSTQAQQSKAPKKYQGLLWEISGNGLTKPSYLFGTMHVSSKLAFHLADSFYYAIKSADVVALETNPITWQDDFSKQTVYNPAGAYSPDYSYRNNYGSPSSDYFKERTFAFKDYEEVIKWALPAEPSMINGMLYRTYNYMADYEEDTYLDMYIFQTGSKLGKRMSGVEDFDESEKLVQEAYKDDMKDRRKKGNKEDEEDEPEEPEETDEEKKNKKPYTIQDAYRKGDLDYIDSLDNKHNRNMSKVFLEKFLYKRNEIQAHSIDTILKKKQRLFVGVGCAHLPGDRGIIEMLRKMGYKLRPVQMGDRDSKQKDQIDNIRVPVTFNTVYADDSAFTVSIPGKKFYNFSVPGRYVTQQFADMKNGAYYLVTRIKTNASFIGDSEGRSLRRVDSLLYENIPGKILSKKSITKSGYSGYEITNRTRRGDVQRYNIIVTPFEIIIFKISGIGEYVLKGKEVDQFMNSISFNKPKNNGWATYHKPQNGFAVRMPHTPVMQKDYVTDRLEYWSKDSVTNTDYGILKTNIINFDFIEEDTFDLRMMDMSFLSSLHVTRQVDSKQTKWNGYPALDATYRCKDSSTAQVRFLLQGPVYYAQIAHYQKPDEKNVKQFFESFAIKPVEYPASKLVQDSALRLTVSSPVYPDIKKEKEDLPSYYDYYYTDDEADSTSADDKYIYETRLIGNDTTGEKVFLMYMKGSKPHYPSPFDTIKWYGMDFMERYLPADDEVRYIKKDSGFIGDSIRWYNFQAVDTNSIKTFYGKIFHKKEHGYGIFAMGDTVSKKSKLFTEIFETLKPVDTLKFFPKDTTRYNKKFFADFASRDSATNAKALKRMSEIRFDSLDVPDIQRIIDTLSWKTKNYLSLKRSFISELGSYKMENTKEVVPYLKKLYTAAQDTSDLQNEILTTLLNLRTKESFTAFKDLIVNEPPAIVGGSDNKDYSRMYNTYEWSSVNIKKYLRESKKKNKKNSYDYLYGNNNEDEGYDTWYQCVDTPQLARHLFPDILQLINLDDYEDNVKGLLELMVDSSQITAKDYESLYTKFYIEAKQELKKQKAEERQEDIEKAEEENAKEKPEPYYNYSYSGNKPKSDGNGMLEQYATLLMPFWDKNPGIPAFFKDLLTVKSDDIKQKTIMLLLKNNKAVPDSLMNHFAANEKKRIGFYQALAEIKKEKMMPAKYSTQEMLVQSAIAEEYQGEEKYDTVAYLDKLPVTLDGDTGVVYFYKYKAKKEDKKWRIATWGIQPNDSTKYDDSNDEFNSSYNSYSYSYNYGDDDEKKLDENKPVREQTKAILQKMLFRKHESATEFFNGSRYGNYEDYMDYAAPARR